MAEFYENKIRNKESNPKTGNAWCIDDVPKLWKKKVEELLK